MISNRVGYSPLGIKNTSQKVAQRKNNVAFSGNRVSIKKSEVIVGVASLAVLVGAIAGFMKTTEDDLRPTQTVRKSLPQKDTGILEQFNKEIDSSSVMKGLRGAFTESAKLR